MKKIFFLGLFIILITSACATKKELSIEEAKTKTIEFINSNLMQNGDKVTIKSATEEDGLYKMIVVMPSGEEIDSFITKDGKKFFPQSIDIDKNNKKTDNSVKNTKQSENVKIVKSDKPEIELFVMSHCPYGTQTEKGILPVLDTLGDKVNFELKFVDYAMHGKKEIDEQLTQYCIQKNEQKKLHAYLECFLADENKSAECLSKAKVNQTQLKSCIATTDKEFKVSELYADKSTWSGGRYPQFNVNKNDNIKYGVKGSPTLVINGNQVQSGRDSNSLLKTICSAFNNPPVECDKNLSTTPPAPGFGFSGSGSNSGGCGS